MENKHDPYSAKDTGHEWDGIRELKNDPPRWWMMGGYLTIIFLVGYFLLYPSIPLIHGHTRGLLGWTQEGEYKAGLDEIKAVRAPFDMKVAGMSAAQILADPGMSQFSQSSSKALFGDHCAPCHGTGGQGQPGFPTLADDDWLYGGNIDKIQETITLGRQSMMPAYKSTLADDEVNDLLKYVADLPGGKIHEPGRAVFMGQTKGAADCAVCHGEDAKGNMEMGAANLTDRVWRFAGAESGARQTILHGVNVEDDPQTRKAIMPAFGGKLKEDQIKKLAVTVFMFGGGKKE